MSPVKGVHSHRGSISGFDSSIVAANGGMDGMAWSSFLAPQSYDANAQGHHPIQLPLWMQESTGATTGDVGGFGEAYKAASTEVKASPAQGRSWSHQDHYQSPIPHSAQYTSPTYQTPQPMHGRHDSSGSLLGSQLQTHRQSLGASGNMSEFAASTNFDSVLSDLGLPLDGLDGLFVDLPINAATGQSNYSV
ncbi:hypothetical protein [Sporisorium scitamineum]|uniref:Uncharacterized protein n=1 Tax=Sporisorium scitamineum TaxID=49012 RepID=A0A0F7S5B9_9BASI|nr:hypothetical protein [Sporisorium scitamineum]